MAWTTDMHKMQSDASVVQQAGKSLYIAAENGTISRWQLSPRGISRKASFSIYKEEFDCMRSICVAPRINDFDLSCILAKDCAVLAASCKVIKLLYLTKNTRLADRCAVSEERAVVAAETAGRQAHLYDIHSISLCQNMQNFVSGDSLRINFWNIKHFDKTFVAVDLKPTDPSKIREVIISTRCSPRSNGVFGYTTTDRAYREHDFRMSPRASETARVGVQVCRDTDIVKMIYDFRFYGEHAVVFRTFNTLQAYDIRTWKRVHTRRIAEGLCENHLAKIDSAALTSGFKLGICGSKIGCGSFKNTVAVFDLEQNTETRVRANTREPSTANNKIDYVSVVDTDIVALSARTLWRYKHTADAH